MANEFVMGAKMTLKDDFSGQVKTVRQATENLNKSVGKTDNSTAKMATTQTRAAAEMGRMNREAHRSKDALDGGAKSADRFSRGLKTVIAAAGAYFSIRAITSAVRGWTEAAKAQIAAETRLETLMKNVPGTTEKQIKAIKLYASELQGLTTVGDEVAISGASQLATFQLQADSIAKLMPAMNDLAVGTYGVNVGQEQMIQTGNLVGKVLQGQVGALSRIGITFSKQQEEMLKTGTEAQKVATLMEVINQNYGGLAQSMAATDEGRIIQFKNAWGDFREELGKQVLPLMATFASFMLNKLPGIQDLAVGVLGRITTFISRVTSAAEQMGPKIGAVFGFLRSLFMEAFAVLWRYASPVIDWLKNVGLPAVAGYMVEVGEAARTAAAFFMDNWERIKPFLQGIVIVLGTYLAVTKTIALATKIWTAVQWAINAAMMANPIGLIIIGLGLLVGAIIYAVGGWENFKNIILGVWDTIVAAVLPLVTHVRDTIVNAFNSVYSWVMQYWPAIQRVIEVVWAFLSAYIFTYLEAIKNVIVIAFNAILGIVKGVWDMISGVIQIAWSIISGIIGVALSLLMGDWEGAWNSMLDMLQGVWNGITTFFSGLGTVFYESGKAIILTLAEGIKAAVMAPVNAVKGVFKKVRSYLPFSDAKEGPLSSLTLNGSNIMRTLAEGVDDGKKALYKTMENAFSKAPTYSSNYTVGTEFEPGTVQQPKVPGIKAAIDYVANKISKPEIDIPTVPQLFTTLNVGTKFDDAKAPTYNGSYTLGADVNPAGSPPPEGKGKTVTIAKLFDQLVVHGSEGDDAETLAEKVIEKLYEKLTAADDIMGADMGVLLHG